MPPLPLFSSPQRDLKHLPERPFLEGRLLYLGNILSRKTFSISYTTKVTTPSYSTGRLINEFFLSTGDILAIITALEFEGNLLQVSTPKSALDSASASTDNIAKMPVTSAPIPTNNTSEDPVACSPINLPHSKGSITMSPSADDKCNPKRMKETLEQLRYPAEYTYSPPTWDKGKVEHATMMRMAEREKEDGRSLLVNYGNMEDGIRVRCQPNPSPLAMDDEHRKTTWIYVVSPEASHITKRITLDQLPEWEAKGWKEFHVRRDHIAEGTDFDKRKISLIQDVYTTDKPAMDTLWIFPTGVCLSEISDDVIWDSNKLIHPNGVKAITSTSDVFIGPLEEGSSATATSQGHHVKHPRPRQVGAGWGDYDHYHEWQLGGRKVMSHMVPEKSWPTSIPDTVRFEITSGKPRPGDVFSTENEIFDEPLGDAFPRSSPIGLRERLLKSEETKANRNNKKPSRHRR
ncbi:hypothetical protein FPOAC1_003595 [Fusarium poae]|uniref:hypothetical protein n=1 Tax=Fusarium poae TaxID=36050 RepID=UPI001CEAE48F|nr:hypothetical protein FPOAC1_003595 [Fusarium poae]KAG8677571.1 hypothetical protein FPOAC1_003595 [Fusarium poae]